MDFYTKEAKRLGYGSRAAFKLVDIDKKYNVIYGKCLELGSFPGGWTEVALKKCKSLVSVDVKQCNQIGNETFINGDILDQTFVDDVLSQYAPFHTIISDVAPNISGIRERDEENFVEIIRAVSYIIKSYMRQKGNCVIKFFNYEAPTAEIKIVKTMFQASKYVRPVASKSQSSEMYLVANGYLYNDVV